MFGISYTGHLSCCMSSNFLLIMIVTMLYTFGSSPGQCLTFVFFAFVIGSSDAMLAFTQKYVYVITLYMKFSQLLYLSSELQ